MFFIICQGCAQTSAPSSGPATEIIPGAWSTEAYLSQLQGKNTGLVVNHTSTIRSTHLADTLISMGVKVTALFTPEHGLRGLADAGAHVKDGIDTATGVRVISLYGDKRKPARGDLAGIDIVIFDIQDVGVRFYTYISTLHYMMEVAAELGIPVIVLDRPNPNGHYIDGPVLDTSRFRSFVGMHPIPVVYGMTIGELAQMINGEGWIPKKCDLTVIPCKQYDHTMMYELPYKPSPNLPNLRSVLLYPGICFFEGTSLSLGRGTATPFQVVGHPDYPDRTFSFTPQAMPGAMSPPLKDKRCYGMDLSDASIDSLFQKKQLDLSILLHFYSVMDKKSFFNAPWFDQLAGTASFRKAIESGRTEDEIRESWKEGLEVFKMRRKEYLLYKDF